MRLADEYDAAQDRGEVKRANNEKTASDLEADQNLLPEQKKVSAQDLGLTHKDVHEARQRPGCDALRP